MASRKPRKPPRPREYTGPPTLEAVKAFCQSDPLPTKKAMEQAAKTLAPEEYPEFMRWALERFKQSMAIYREAMDAEWKRRGIDFSKD